MLKSKELIPAGTMILAEVPLEFTTDIARRVFHLITFSATLSFACA
jgi:hypothetical protein